MGAGSVVVRDVPPDSTVVGVPAHIVYQGGKRVLITDPHEVNDPLSGVIIALADEVKRLRMRVDVLDGQLELATRDLDEVRRSRVEEEEREQYHSEQASGIREYGRGNLSGSGRVQRAPAGGRGPRRMRAQRLHHHHPDVVVVGFAGEHAVVHGIAVVAEARNLKLAVAAADSAGCASAHDFWLKSSHCTSISQTRLPSGWRTRKRWWVWKQHRGLEVSMASTRSAPPGKHLDEKPGGEARIRERRLRCAGRATKARSWSRCCFIPAAA